MDAVEELLAREKIKDVKARYCRFLDTKNWEGFADLFTEDAVLDVREDTGSEPFHGRPAILETVRSAVQYAQSAHQVHTPEITFDGPDAVDVIWAMQDRVVWQDGKSPIPPVTAITGYGHYRERYVRRDGRWWIASLKLTRLYVERHY
jgi:uncharacterized protein (TIGR02246 family)